MSDLSANTRLVEPELPPPDRSYLWIGAVQHVAAFLAVMIFLAGLAWATRIPLTNALLPPIASTLIDQPVTLTVSSLNADRIEIADLSVQNGPAADRLILTRRDDRLDSVTVEGLTAHVVVAPDGTVSLPGLENLLNGKSDDTAQTLAVPFSALTLSDIDILADTPVGRDRVTGNIRVAFQAAPDLFPLTAAIGLEASDSDSAISFDIGLAGDRLSAQGAVDLSLSHWGRFLPGVTAIDGRATGSVDFEGLLPQEIATPDSLLAALTGQADVTWTGITLSLRDMPDIAVQPGSATLSLGGGQAVVDRLTGMEARADGLPANIRNLLPDAFADFADSAVQVAFSGHSDIPVAVFRPNTAGGWGIALNGTLDGSVGPIAVSVTPSRIDLDRTGNATALSIDSASLDAIRGLSLPRDVELHLTLGSGDIDLTTQSALPDLTFPYQLEAVLHGDVIKPIWVRTAELEAAGTLSLSGERIDIAFDPGTSARIDGLTGTGDIRLSPRLRVDIAGRDPARLSFATDDPVGTMSLTASARLGETSVALPNGGPALAISRHPVSLNYSPDGIVLAAGPADIRDLKTGVSLTRAAIRVEESQGIGTLSLSGSGIAVQGDPVLPGRVTAQFAFDRDGSLSGPATLADGRVHIAVDRRDGVLAVETDPIAFGPGGLTYADILPQAMRDDLGIAPTISGIVTAAYRSDGDLQLTLNDLGIGLPEATVSRLNGTLAFQADSLPATRGSQSLKGSLILPGLGTLPMTGRFSVAPDGTASIDTFTLALFSGELALVGGRFDPAGPSLDGTVRVRRMDLSQSLAALSVQGVSGTGMVSGAIPIHVSANDAVIKAGTLAAEGDGALSIDNDTVNQALASDQQAVQLLVDVLKDFQYDELGAELDLPPNGDGRIGLRLSGRNPAVLDGHPFKLNVNIESDFHNLFDILKQILSLSGKLARSFGQNSP
ncbi:hypothetical protein HH303_06145 [Rhodospirillaceae bacterium KN72]|uniref:Dicarboxylate transport domain-containing protein n=1 Tax=Pacificispira spongiicola TaxID=2729598 RepID=A0A7Y0HG71_9PROT|nr:YdbH domain-containing protein [Pacificispira spongiicola]NMM44049.1 hypothetical protein [Pacificispira spongiicola]